MNNDTRKDDDENKKGLPWYIEVPVDLTISVLSETIKLLKNKSVSDFLQKHVTIIYNPHQKKEN